MKKENPLPEAFLLLVEKRLDGDITAGEQAELERHLTHTPGAMAYYVAMADADTLLADEFPGAGKVAGNTVAFRRSGSRRLLWISTALASGAAAALVAIVWSRSDTDSGAARDRVATGGAQVVRSLGVTWVKGGPLPGGKLDGAAGEISGGFLELKLTSGVKLLIEGPAAFDVGAANACRLAYGKAVADVPDGAQGFTLDSPGERIIDHGTRFAVDVAGDGRRTTVGVLSGEIEVRRDGKDVHLYTDYALQRDDDAFASVPFERGRFATEIPSREFPWNMNGAKPGEERALHFDVSRLVHGPGDYRAVFKWLRGADMLNVRAVELLRDGEPVARREQPFSTGSLRNTQDNTQVLRIPPGAYAKARWELVAYASCQFTDEKLRKTPPDSGGIVTLEDGLALAATEKEFIGRWRYSHNGVDQEREFLPGGNFRAWKNGRPDPWGDGLHYTVKDGILTLPQRHAEPETHMLRDDGTLVFLNQPYRNAHREKTPEAPEKR